MSIKELSKLAMISKNLKIWYEHLSDKLDRDYNNDGVLLAICNEAEHFSKDIEKIVWKELINYKEEK